MKKKMTLSLLKTTRHWLNGITLLGWLLLSACSSHEQPLLAGGIGGTGISSGIGGTGISSGIGGTGISGIGGTGITALGVVQGFGSIFVNGREYFLTDNTRIIIDGRPATEQDLKLGETVLVRATLDTHTGAALTLAVEGRHALQGKVEKVDADNGYVTMLGQQIAFTPDSVIQDERGIPLSLRHIQPGDSVSVSGLARDGKLLATGLTRTPASVAQTQAPFLLRGTVTAINAERTSLRVGAQAFNVHGARVPASLQMGQAVVVRGQYSDGVPRALSVEEDRIELGKPGDRVELIGYVDGKGKLGHFSSNRVNLRYDEQTIVAGGDTGDIAPKRLVAVHGTVEKDGRVAVERVAINISPMDYKLERQPKTRPDHKELRKPSIDQRRKEGNAQTGTMPEKSRSGKSPADKVELEKHKKGKPEVDNPLGDKPEHDGQELERPETAKPEREKPEAEKPEVETPNVEKPDIEKPEVDDIDLDAKPERPRRDKINRDQ